MQSLELPYRTKIVHVKPEPEDGELGKIVWPQMQFNVARADKLCTINVGEGDSSPTDEEIAYAKDVWHSPASVFRQQWRYIAGIIQAEPGAADPHWHAVQMLVTFNRDANLRLSGKIVHIDEETAEILNVILRHGTNLIGDFLSILGDRDHDGTFHSDNS